MACIKTNVAGELVVELFSGKRLTASELVELDGQWAFFNQVVRVCQEALTAFTRTRSWVALQKRLPQSKRGGACHWRDVVIILLIAPFLTRNNIAALCRWLDRSVGLQVVLGIQNIPSEGRISVYKNQLLGEVFFRQLRMLILYRLQRQGGLALTHLAIDGAPLRARVNADRISPFPNLPLALIQRTFQELAITWVDFYYPPRNSRQIPTSTIVIYYLLMYWLGFRSLGALYGYLGTHPEVLDAVGLPRQRPTLNVFRTFRTRLRTYVQRWYGDQAPYHSIEDLIRAICADACASFMLWELFQLDHFRSNEYLFNVFRHKKIIGDPDAMYGCYGKRRRIILGYRVILLVDVSTKAPLFGFVVPGNQSERLLGIPVLEAFYQTLAESQSLQLPVFFTLFADLGYDWQPTDLWMKKQGIRFLISSQKDLCPRTSRWRAKHRIQVEQALSDLSEFFGLNRLRTQTQRYVQTFVEILLCARVMQVTIAFLNGGDKDLRNPTYPIFGRKGC